MTDPRTIEGTPERAADRGRGDELEFAEDARPSLGDPSVTRGLVSEFAAECVDVRKRYNLDKLSGEQALEELRRLAQEYGAVVMGRSDKYATQRWHSPGPGRLGMRIEKVTSPAEGVTDPGERLFLSVGNSVMSIAQAHEIGELTDQAAEAHAQSILEDAANLILGVR